MAKLSMFLPPFAADYSGAAGVLFGLDNLNVIVDASCCTRNYTMIDEPRWMKTRKSTFGAQLRTLEATLGNDERLLDQIEKAAGELGVSCITLIGTPVPALVGMDFEGMAWELEDRCGVPVVGVDTTGFGTYELGASRMQRQLVERFADQAAGKATAGVNVLGEGGGRAAACGDASGELESDAAACAKAADKASMPEVAGARKALAQRRANVLGATVQDFGSPAALEALTCALQEQGYDLVWNTAGAYSLGDVARAATASKSIVCSWSGLEAARELKRRFGIPYRVGVSREALEAVPGVASLLAQAGTDAVAPLLIVHDQVIANSIREALQASGVQWPIHVASLFAMDESLMQPGDFHIAREADLIAFAKENPDTALAGDPLLRNLPYAGKLLTWELPHEAVSSNLYLGGRW